MADRFVAYRGGPDLHDGTVVKVEEDGETARVRVKAVSGREVEVHFDGVASITQHRAEGMMIYALSEMEHEPPLRQFVFGNWDDEDDAQLAIVARDYDFREGS